MISVSFSARIEILSFVEVEIMPVPLHLLRFVRGFGPHLQLLNGLPLGHRVGGAVPITWSHTL